MFPDVPTTLASSSSTTSSGLGASGDAGGIAGGRAVPQGVHLSTYLILFPPIYSLMSYQMLWPPRSLRFQVLVESLGMVMDSRLHKVYILILSLSFVFSVLNDNFNRCYNYIFCKYFERCLCERTRRSTVGHTRYDS